MRTRNYSFVTPLLLLSLVCGTIGCTSNGGPWYKTNSYSWQNPFKSKGDTVSDRTATAKPSIGVQPNVTAPLGGYGDPSREAEFQASKPEKQVQPQYGNTITGGATPTGNRVAMSEAPAYGGNTSAGYTYPDPGVHPNQYSSNTGVMTPQMYPQTSIQQPTYSPNYPSAGPNPADYAAPSNGLAPPAYPPSTPSAGYSPFAAPGYDAPPQQGVAAPATPSYGAPQQEFGAPQQNYGTPQQNYGAPQQGFGADVNGYTAPPSYGSGYIATPSTTGGYN